jgi:endonuclease G
MSRNGLLQLLAIGLLLLILAGCTWPATDPNVSGSGHTQAVPSNANRNIRFGMPSKAQANLDHKHDYLLDRPQWVAGYNDATKTPNWVAWQLVKSDCPGNADRGGFKSDPLLPKGITKVSEAPYTNTGFDRGHLCPSADRSDNETNNDETFIMTNIMPQAPDLNRKGWERMETYCRNLAKQGKELLIVTGPLGKGGEGSKGPAETIGSGKGIVTVPAKCWKVVMVLPKEGAVPDKATRTFAVIMPNKQGLDSNWPDYRVSVREVETQTGLNFFPDLSTDVTDVIENLVDDTRITVVPFKKSKSED